MGRAGWSGHAAGEVQRMSDMNWQHASIVAVLAYLALMVALCWTDSRKKRRRNRLLTRLNSPFFRNAYDAHYRVGNVSGVGK